MISKAVLGEVYGLLKGATEQPQNVDLGSASLTAQSTIDVGTEQNQQSALEALNLAYAGASQFDVLAAGPEHYSVDIVNFTAGLTNETPQSRPVTSQSIDAQMAYTVHVMAPVVTDAVCYIGDTLGWDRLEQAASVRDGLAAGGESERLNPMEARTARDEMSMIRAGYEVALAA